MVTNFFLIGNHFEEFRSQVAIRKKKLIIRLVLVTLKKGYYVNQWLVHISAMRSLCYETLAEKFEEHSRDCNCSQLHLKQFLCAFHAVKPLHIHCTSYLHEYKLMLESIINFYLLEISLQVIAAPHILIWNTLVANSILKVLLDGIVGKVYASDYFKDMNSSVFWLLARCLLLIILKI